MNLKDISNLSIITIYKKRRRITFLGVQLKIKEIRNNLLYSSLYFNYFYSHKCPSRFYNDWSLYKVKEELKYNNLKQLFFNTNNCYRLIKNAIKN